MQTSDNVTPPATLFCYSCRTFQPEAAMRRVVTRSGERWRCVRCLEAAGIRNVNSEEVAQIARREALIDEILRENPWAQRKKDHFGRALFLSLVAHLALVSLQFGSQGFGMPWSRPAEDDRPMQLAAIHAVLRAPIARIESLPLTDQSPPPPPEALPTPTESIIPNGATLASLRSASRPVLAAKPESPTPRRKEKAKAAVRSKGSEVLGTEEKSTWQMPVARQESSAAEEDSPSEPVKQVETPEKTDTAADDAARKEAEKAAEKTAAIAKANEEAQERKRAEELTAAKVEAEKAQQAAANAVQEAADRQREQARAEVEKRKAEQAAIAKASAEALERKQAEERLRLEAEKKLAEKAAAKAHQEALELKKAEEQLRAETERRRVEAAAVEKARQDAAERLRAEERAQELARAEAARQQAEQAAAKARQESDQRAQDKAMDAKRAEDLARGRQAGPEANAQNGAGKPTDRGPNQGTRAPEHNANASPGRSTADPVGVDTRRKASITGPDPRNIQLSFYGEGWRQKVERIGSVNYPKVYRDRYYDTLVVTVTINSDGSLAGVRIVKSSGQKEMDDAVRRIVELSAPFAAFPPDLKRSYDQLDITRTWSFEHGPRIRAQ